MKLATIKSSERDGRLAVVNTAKGVLGFVPAATAKSMLDALERWDTVQEKLRAIDAELSSGAWKETAAINTAKFASPLPRTFSFLDGSAYLSHVRRVRKSRGADMPAEFEEIPLMYQGVSAPFLGPADDVRIIDESSGVDFEAEIAVVLDDTPAGVKAADAAAHVKLIILLNDISLRNVIPGELARGFGFLQGKPPSACGPFAVTPDELGGAWRAGRPALEMRTAINGSRVGNLRTEEMHFSFGQLIEFAARTRPLPAGSIIGSGTVSNNDEASGIGCLVERRVIEIIAGGEAITPYLKRGDEVSIEAFLDNKSVFGEIRQRYI